MSHRSTLKINFLMKKSLNFSLQIVFVPHFIDLTQNLVVGIVIIFDGENLNLTTSHQICAHISQ